MMINPCLRCGACCACFRASFYWTEVDEVSPGGVPMELTDKLNDFMLVMKGTNQPHPKCICLSGEISRHVFCTIYEPRSSTCRGFNASWITGNPKPTMRPCPANMGTCPADAGVLAGHSATSPGGIDNFKDHLHWMISTHRG